MIKPISFNKTNFQARHKNNIEKSPLSNNGDLIHTSHFFRYDKNHHVNEYIGNYLKKCCTSNPVNIVSMGCSYGEEVYSLAMTMDFYDIKSNVVGFDISQQALNGIQSREYNLSGYEVEYLFPDLYGYSTKEKPSEFQEGIRKEFNKNFKLIDSINKTFKVKYGSFKNCHFFKGDVTKLDTYFKGNSQDMISCCFVLYHLSDREKINTLNQIYNTLKPNGILCVSPTEKDMFNLIKYCGFEEISYKYPWIFKKTNYSFRRK